MKTIICVTAMMLAFGFAFAAPQAQPVTKEDFAKVCPLDVAGASATSASTADGVTVTFSTAAASWIPEVKSGVEKLSELLNRATAHPPTGPDRPAVLFASTFEATKDGGRIVLKPKKAADLETLQANVAAKIGKMNSEKTCHLLASVN